jgi:hypothetical protein
MLDVSNERREIGNADRLREVARLPPPRPKVARRSLQPLQEVGEGNGRGKAHDHVNVVRGVSNSDDFAAQLQRRAVQEARKERIVGGPYAWPPSASCPDCMNDHIHWRMA